jgi:hypothetical protein
MAMAAVVPVPGAHSSESSPPGAVHKFLVPSMNAALGPNVWQSIDITLVGRRIWIVVNGRPVITDQIIPGRTGSAVDGDESTPGLNHGHIIAMDRPDDVGVPALEATHRQGPQGAKVDHFMTRGIGV